MQLKDYLLVLVVCLVWSFNFVAGSKGVEAFSPLVFMVLRFVLVLGLTWPFLRRPPRGQWLRLASVCILIGALHFTVMFWALQRSADVTSIAIIQNMYIPMAVVLAIVLLGERAGWRTLLATGTAFAGVLVIGFDPLVLRQPDALALILLSAFFQALGSVWMRGIQGVGPISFQAWSAVFSLPLLVLATLLIEDGQLAMIRSAQGIHWAALLYSVLMASLVGHGLFFWLIQRNPVPNLMPYMLLMPVFAAAFGVLVWGDTPGPRLILGGVIVLASILVITLRGRRRALPRATRPAGEVKP